jgi:hypothetical protein
MVKVSLLHAMQAQRERRSTDRFSFLNSALDGGRAVNAPARPLCPSESPLILSWLLNYKSCQRKHRLEIVHVDQGTTDDWKFWNSDCLMPEFYLYSGCAYISFRKDSCVYSKYTMYVIQRHLRSSPLAIQTRILKPPTDMIKGVECIPWPSRTPYGNTAIVIPDGSISLIKLHGQSGKLETDRCRWNRSTERQICYKYLTGLVSVRLWNCIQSHKNV